MTRQLVLPLAAIAAIFIIFFISVIRLEFKIEADEQCTGLRIEAKVNTLHPVCETGG